MYRSRSRFSGIMTVQLLGAVPVATGSMVTVIYNHRTSIMDRIVILISRFYEMFSWGESRPLYFGLVPPSAPLIPPIVVLTDISCFQSIHSRVSFTEINVRVRSRGACPTVPAFYPCRTPLTRVHHCSIFRNNAYYTARTCDYKGREVVGCQWISSHYLAYLRF